MNKKYILKDNILVHTALCILLIILQLKSFGQQFPASFPAPVKNGIQFEKFFGSFIENIGQYGKSFPGKEQMGKIQFGYEGLDMPVLFTSKGLIHLQRKISMISHREERRMERKGLPEEEIERSRKVTDRTIFMEWVGANENVEIVTEQKAKDYHTYGLLPDKAYGYQKITYKELYPGIDVVYTLSRDNRTGYEYSLVIRPGANLGAVKMKYDGDVRSIRMNETGQLIIRSGIAGIEQDVALCYYSDSVDNNIKATIKTNYSIKSNLVTFSLPQQYDHNRTLIIDPFVTATGNLTGANLGKAKDVDFDYAGNVYVTGGGDGVVSHNLAKFNSAGVLQWTFNGTMSIPVWNYGPYYGGSVVEKPTGNVYLGQGFIYPAGFQVIRINTAGLYDNFITTPNGNFTENWKMYWACNNGTPQILIAGGGINSNVNFGIFTPPSTTIDALNVTGLAGAGQDIADLVIDPANNDMYTAYASLILSPEVNNKIYKNTAPYSPASIAWNLPSGYTTLSEASNRPYLAVSMVDNSANIFAVNANYLFYWDGKNLKAFNKATGAAVGTPLSTANAALNQGGIIADACNNVFVGDVNGTIKVYNFNGSTFNDAAAADITIPGFTTKSVYDLAYNDALKLLYASGDGFVASFNVASYCSSNVYTLNVVSSCVTAQATATVSPVPPAGSTITYVLSIGNTTIDTNTTGVFTGLLPNTAYTIVATINLACSGVRATANFTLPGPTILTTITNTTCGNNTGQINASGSGSTAPYSYSINGINFQPSGLFNGLAAGIYTVTVTDANGCSSTKSVTILNTNAPTLGFSNTNATCGNNTASITATASGGTAPYLYSIDNGITFQGGNVFNGLIAGQYTLVVRDANGCTNSVLVTITSTTAPLLTATPASATCGTNNGTITAFGSAGTAPLVYSINGNIYQAGTVFSNLAPGTYTVYVKDASGCINSTIVTVNNNPAPTVTAVTTAAACGNINGTIIASGLDGVPPLQYSINGTTFQASGTFTGLAPGTYTVTVKDASGCSSTIPATVAATGGPTVTANTSASSCNTNNGTITAVASGTIGTYQYSINGTTFQLSGTFTGLAAGNYVVFARDGNLCLGAVAVTVTAIAAPTVSAVTVASSCLVNNGSITATGLGGTAPLQYSINGTTFQSSGSFSGLAPNTYTVTVKDVNGCTSTIVVVVANASGLTLSVNTVSSSCSAVNGSITAIASGGQAPLQYSINGTTYQASNVFTALSAGSYTVYVKDANGCIISSQTNLSSVSGAVLSVTTTNTTCASANGIIIASGSGGAAPLQYSINGTVYQASGTFIGVAAGTYTVYVKDALNCIATQSVTLTNSGAGPGISTFTVSITKAYLCNGALGRITNPKVNGATCGTCTFSLNFGPFIPNAAQLFTNLAPGTYTVTAKDANGCTKTIFAVVALGVPSTATYTSTGSACNASTGTVTITGVGTNTPYHASINGIGGPWVTFDPSYTFTGLAPGIYTIILADDESFDIGPPVIPGGCLDTIQVIVPAIGGPSLSVSHTNETCQTANGTITALGSAGTPPLQYSIDGGPLQDNGLFTDLVAGTYIVSVTDATGCTMSSQVTITGTASPAISASTLPTSCNLNNGTITISGTGGTAPYQYSLDGTIFQSSNTFSNLAANSYTVFIKDAAGCFSFVSVTIDVSSMPAVSAFALPASCNYSDGSIYATGVFGNAPYQFSINGTVYQSSNIFSGLAAGFYTLYIKDSRNCVNTTGITIGNLAAPNFSTVVANAKCGNANGSITVTATGGTAPIQYSIDGTNFQPGNILSGLLPGTYTVTIKDANGCLANRTILVGNNAGPHTLNATVINAACGFDNGTITAEAIGGTDPLQYSIDGINYQASTDFFGVAAGSYSLYVKDANGCIKTKTVSVLNLAGPGLSVTSTTASCSLNDGTITALSTGGTGTMLYSIDGINFQLSNVFIGLPAGPYTITVMDELGCMEFASVNVSSFIAPGFSAITVDASCGAANGSITLNGSGGVAPYLYSVDGINFQPSNQFNGLFPGSYQVWILDVNNCAGTGSVTLADSPGMSGTYTVGATGNFHTLTAAVDAYNTRCLTGPIIFSLTDPLYSTNETFPIQINSNIYASSFITLTIKPAAGTNPVISANNPSAAIRFNGADYVTIDGSNSAGGTTRNLSIINTSTNNTTSTVLWMNSVSAGDAASNLAVENCIITGNAPTTTVAAVMLSGSVAGTIAEAPNTDNSILNNLVTKAQTGIALIGPVGNETGNIISGNTIGSATAASKLSLAGIQLNQEENCIVSNNNILGINTGTVNSVSGIAVMGTTAFTNISANTISDIKNTNTGGFGSNGIYLGSTTTNATIKVNNNFIADVASYGKLSRSANDNGYGIVVNSGSGYYIFHNTVVLNTNQTVSGYPAALNITAAVTTAAAVDLQDNIFGNIQTQAGSHFAIQSDIANTVFASTDYNDYYVASGDLGYIGSNRTTLANIQAGFGANTHSINITPVYLSATDLHINAANVSNGVNLGDRGINVGITTDIDHTSRSGFSPDMGADEWLKPNYGSWVGLVSIDWLVPENWETNVVPDGTTDVTIKGGFTFMPTIVTTQAVHDLNMSAPDVLNTPILTLNNGTIQINGTINHTGGTIDGINGTVEMNGTVPQTIPANLFQNNALNNLVIGNNTVTGVTLAGALDIYRSVTFAAAGLKLTTANLLTFKSTSTETAWLGDMTGKTIVGEATVERYIPGHSKAWQLLAVPTVGQTIKQAWQEGSAMANSNPVPGFGTQLTSNPANATTHPSPGFDLYSAAPSIKTYHASNGLYDAVINTAIPIANPKGYMLFVRGDRSVTTFNAPATETVLRTKGTLFTPNNPPAVTTVNTGTVPFTFESIGNPYASAIDLTKLTLNESGGGVQDIFYVWDPKLTTGPNSVYGLGGFQSLTRNGNTYDVTPGGGSYAATNKYIQSGQAFFANAPFTTGTVKFTEAAKANGSSLVTRPENIIPGKQLQTNLYVFKSGERVLIDGNRIQYDKNYSNNIDMLDAVKLDNTGENLGIRSKDHILSVERRSIIQPTDTIFYNMCQVKAQQYQFEFVAINLQQPRLEAFLEDNYLHTKTPVGLNDTTRIFFNIENITGSYAPNRFRIIFHKKMTEPVIHIDDADRISDHTIHIHWLVENENNMLSYSLEQSNDGTHFISTNSLNALGNKGETGSYESNDGHTYHADIYYRIKGLAIDGTLLYSNVVKILAINQPPGISVYPNPVTDRVLKIQFIDQSLGNYQVTLINKLGQAVFEKILQLDDANKIIALKIDAYIASGTYQLTITAGTGKKLVQKLVIN